MGTQHFLDTAVVQYAVAEEEHEVLFVEEHAVRFLFCKHVAQFCRVTFPLAPEFQWCANRSISELHTVIGSNSELCSSEEGRDEVTLI